jgi:hypothetical protein
MRRFIERSVKHRISIGASPLEGYDSFGVLVGI